MKKVNLAIVGVTGAVGQEFLKLIEERNFPYNKIKMLASARSAGKKINFMGKEYTVEETTENSFEGVDIALFAGGKASKLFGPAAVKAGAVVIDELKNQLEDLAEGKTPQANILPVASLNKHYQIASNLLPQIDIFMDNDYTKEEMKMIDETRKIMEDADMKITATTVRVPVYRSHAESVNVEFYDEVSAESARAALEKFEGVTVRDNPAEMIYPQPLETSGKDNVEVGRLRKDYSVEHGLNFWVCGDQIRKGAALNALQIAEKLIGK